MQLRIAIDARPFEPQRTGIGRYLESLLLTWLSEFPRDQFVLLSPRPIFLPLDLVNRVECHVSRLGLPGTLWLQTQAPLEARSRSAMVFLGTCGILPAASSLPGLATVHDLTPLLFPSWHPFKNRLGFVPFIAPTVREAAHLFTVSRASRDDLVRFFPEAKAKTSIVYNGVAQHLRHTQAGPPPPGLPHPYVLFLGTMEPRKNIERLAAAMETLWDRSPSFPSLVIAGGEGWGLPGFRQQLERSRHRDRIHFAGYVSAPDVPSLIAGARVLAYPSLYEGFGLPPLEAMALGTPVVASSSSSLPEVVGDAGLLPDPGSIPQIATALQTAVENEEWRKRAIQKGRDRARHFTWTAAVQAMRPRFLEALR